MAFWPFFISDMPFYVYILHSVKFGRYYIGQTQNFEHRFIEHNSKKVLSTAAFIPWNKIGIIEKDSRSQAMVLEKKLKNLNRQRLELFIAKYLK